MSDNPTYRQGQDRPSDDYYDDRYAGRPQEDARGGRDPRGYGQGGYPQPDPNHPPRQGYPDNLIVAASAWPATRLKPIALTNHRIMASP